MIQEFGNDVNQALKTLQMGGIIIYPTDTIWGIGCDATNRAAVERVYSIKKRTEQKAMIVLMPEISWLSSYIRYVPEVAFQLIEIADKPLTLVLEGAFNLASNLMAPDGSIAVRIVRDPFCKALLEKFRKPIVSTSANFSGEPAPALFTDIEPRLLAMVDYVVTWRQNDLTPGKPSSIIRLGPGGEVSIIRP
ncbi:MAG TPA: L-threonylcarbamoyladenylate synthase [Bacteroidales bacterium]|nr:L-threonylcarbamoyladenylate synthase [Bacteroidales bacterium]